MNEILKIVLSLSFSGSLLILVLFFCKPLFRNRISKCWQYYIWLVVIARLLLPFSPETSLVGTLFGEGDQSAPMQTAVPLPAEQGTAPLPQAENGAAIGESVITQGGEAVKSATPLQTLRNVALQNLWPVWLVVALILLMRKITIYQGFVRYIKAGRTEVSDTAILDRLALIGEQAGVKTPVELYTNSLISSPLLLGFFRPCIVLPTIDIPDSDLQYIILHELTHYKRRDMFYKWLVQLTICLHWFNPLTYLMGREMSRACELACDEAVICKLDGEKQRAYGDTLLNAIVTGGDYRDSLASMTLNESQELLKERLGAIMTFQKNRKTTAILAVVLAICLCWGSFMLGSYVAQPTLKTVPMEQMVFSDEGLPIMNAQNRELYERYLKPIAVTGILYCNFSPEDISGLVEEGGEGLLNLVAVLESEKLSENSQDGKVSAAFVEEVLTTRFPLWEAVIRDTCADIYDAQSDTYDYPGGLGGGPFIPIVTGSATNGRLTTLYYTAYVGDPAADKFQYIAGTSGELIIEGAGKDFKYLSNKVIPVEDQPNQNAEYGLTVYVGGRDISQEIIRLWHSANNIYNVDDNETFQMGDSVFLFESGPEYQELLNYDQEVDAVFTTNGKAQLEQTKIGGDKKLIQKQDGKIYRMGAWKTGYSYGEALEGLRVVAYDNDTLTLQVKYKQLVGVGNPPAFGYADFTAKKIADQWYVESYQYPEAYFGL